MPQNPRPSELDWNTALKHCIDRDEDALRVLLPQVSVSLSHLENDTITAHKPSLEVSGVGSIASTNCKEISTFSLYSKDLSAGAVAFLEISPSDVDDVWFTLGSFSSSSDYVRPTKALGCRIRASISNGTGKLYLVGRG